MVADYAGLVERLERATGADRDLDRDIYFTFNCVPNEGQVVRVIGKSLPVDRYPYLLPDSTPTDGTLSPAYTASLDAAIALVERVLPGWTWIVGGLDETGLFQAGLGETGGDGPEIGGTAKTPAIALLLAILRALEAKP